MSQKCCGTSTERSVFGEQNMGTETSKRKGREQSGSNLIKTIYNQESISLESLDEHKVLANMTMAFNDMDDGKV